MKCTCNPTSGQFPLQGEGFSRRRFLRVAGTSLVASYFADVVDPRLLLAGGVEGEAQVERWHHALVQAISRMPSPGSPMQELAVFSLRAAVRFHQIRLREDRSPSNDGGLEARAAARPGKENGRA